MKVRSLLKLPKWNFWAKSFCSCYVYAGFCSSSLPLPFLCASLPLLLLLFPTFLSTLFISSHTPSLCLLMDLSKCSPGALQLPVVLHRGGSSALRRCRFSFVSRSGATKDALDEVDLSQSHSLAGRWEVSPRTTTSGTWWTPFFLFTGFWLFGYYAAGRRLPLSGPV